MTLCIHNANIVHIFKTCKYFSCTKMKSLIFGVVFLKNDMQKYTKKEQYLPLQI